MKLKSLLLGSAAVLVAVSGARAADAIVVEPEPVEYVRVCDAYGKGWFYIPGTETCIACLETIDPDYGSLARFLVATGARVGEALNLTWADIHDNKATFWETKAATPRTVPLSRQAIAALAFQKGKHPAGPFKTVRYANFRNAWNRAKQRCGLGRDPQVVPHVLRHTCASRLAQSGVDIKRIQEFLGHKTLAMTLRYAHLSPSHLDVCAAALDKFEADGKRNGAGLS